MSGSLHEALFPLSAASELSTSLSVSPSRLRTSSLVILRRSALADSMAATSGCGVAWVPARGQLADRDSGLENTSHRVWNKQDSGRRQQTGR